ncbi:unnamed protein product [Ceratitis capitata]|uniref:(Mediterranean fruit fly) hypothetical protein n=1 Tax=Ceratitis capitata TaxID=7213 RepID=A0A811URW5_CERCA|nr:unnamed protein product [Ceratitis capitata]
MSADVKEYVSKCDICRQRKSTNITLRPPMITQYNVQRPFQKLYIDLIGPYPRSKKGNIGILIVLDHVTKYPLLKEIKYFNANLICDYLKELFSLFGTPEIILSDNGKQFKSQQFNALLTDRGVRHVFTALYSPQANASERVNRSIIAGIRTYLKNDQTHWDRHLIDIAEALRNSHHQSIGCSPYFALFGQQMVSHADEYKLLRKLESLDDNILSRNDKLNFIRKTVMNNIARAFENSAKRYNLRSTIKNFKIGDIVFRRNFTQSDAAKKFCAKLAPKFIKAKVISLKGNCMYELEDCLNRKRAIYHRKDIQEAIC